jgi:hypothetical protein
MCYNAYMHMLTMVITKGTGVGGASDGGVVEVCCGHVEHML